MDIKAGGRTTIALRAGQNITLLITNMTLQATGPLDQQINRGQVGNQHIKIKIQTLFDHLRCDKYLASTLLRV